MRIMDYAIIVMGLIGLVACWRWVVWNYRYNKLRSEYDYYMTYLHGSQSTARNYLDSCRLIAIHRDGRLNVFTYQRNDEIFTIETMGLLGDDVEGWRKRAGVSNV